MAAALDFVSLQQCSNKYREKASPRQAEEEDKQLVSTFLSQKQNRSKQKLKPGKVEKNTTAAATQLIIISSSFFFFFFFFFLLSLQHEESKFQCRSKKTGANLEQTQHVSPSSLLHAILAQNTVSCQLINYLWWVLHKLLSTSPKNKNQKLPLQKQKCRCRRRGGRMGISTVPGGGEPAGE